MGPTQEDVAKKAKVSRALVSLVMRGAPNVSEQRRRRVLRAAEELGYRPNAYARSLASKRLHTIGVLINDVTNPYFGGVYSSLATAAEEAGFDLLVAPGTRSATKESALVRTLLEHRVAGLALLSPLMPTTELRQPHRVLADGPDRPRRVSRRRGRGHHRRAIRPPAWCSSTSPGWATATSCTSPAAPTGRPRTAPRPTAR